MATTSVKIRNLYNGEYWGVYEYSSTTTVEELVEKIALRHTTYLNKNILWYKHIQMDPVKLVSWYEMQPQDEIIIRDKRIWKPFQVRIVSAGVDYSLQVDPFYKLSDLKRRIQTLRPDLFGTTVEECRLYQVGLQEYDDWMLDPDRWMMQTDEDDLVVELGDYGDKLLGLKRVSVQAWREDKKKMMGCGGECGVKRKN